MRQVDSIIARESNSDKSLAPTCSYKKLYSLSTSRERTIMYIGWVFAAITGLGMPSWTFLMGNVLNDFAKGGEEL